MLIRAPYTFPYCNAYSLKQVLKCWKKFFDGSLASNPVKQSRVFPSIPQSPITIVPGSTPSLSTSSEKKNGYFFHLLFCGHRIQPVDRTKVSVIAEKNLVLQMRRQKIADQFKMVNEKVIAAELMPESENKNAALDELEEADLKT